MVIVSGYSESIIPVGITVHGTIEGSEELTVAGTVDGEVDLRGTLRVLESGYLRGRITVQYASISGRVEGTVTASEKAEILSTARIDGEIRAGRLTIVEGALINAKLGVGPANAPPPTLTIR
jgi:cytoskeletal protein CcmA (bactofilin family)